MRPTFPVARPLWLPILIALSLGGCASKEFVQQEIDGVGKRLDALQQALRTAQDRLDSQAGALSQTDQQLKRVDAGQTLLYGRVEAARAAQAETDKDVARLADSLKAAVNRLDGYDSALAESTRQTSALDSRLNTATSLADEARQASLMTASRIEKIENDVATLKTVPPAVTEPAPMAAAEVVTTPLPDIALPPASATSPAGFGDFAAKIEAIARRMEENTQAIQAATERIKTLEGGLSTVQSGVQSSQANLAAASQQVGDIQGKVEAASQQMVANDTVASKRLDSLEGTVTVIADRLDGGVKQISVQGEQIQALDTRLTRNEAETARVSATAREALERAVAAGQLAEGKLLYEAEFSEENAPFEFDSAKLTGTAKQALAAFAATLRTNNQNVFIEIQGHTDNTGTPETNHRLGQARAEAVRDYLHRDHGLPLHRMSVVSYGQSRPVADNDTRSGRAKNRRVQLVVLK